MSRPHTPPPLRVVRVLRVAALILAVSVLARPLAAQDGTEGDGSTPVSVGEEFLEGNPATNRIVATVSGEPITSSDVAYSLRVLTRGGPVDPELEATIIRRMAEEILLAQEATRLGLDLTASQVDDRWKTWFGFKPDYEESALTAGTTVARQRALAKRTVQAELYVYNRVGLMSAPGARIEIDLALKHMVDVTPQQLREAFLEIRDQMGQPPKVAFSVYPSADLETAEEIHRALLRHEEPEGVSPIRQEVPTEAVEEVFIYEPELATFVANSLDGSVSAPTLVQGQQGPIFLVVQVTGHSEAMPAVFAEAQDELRNRIQSNLLVQAKRSIVQKLSRQAVYYPADLFDEPLPDPLDGE